MLPELPPKRPPSAEPPPTRLTRLQLVPKAAAAAVAETAAAAAAASAAATADATTDALVTAAIAASAAAAFLVGLGSLLTLEYPPRMAPKLAPNRLVPVVFEKPKRPPPELEAVPNAVPSPEGVPRLLPIPCSFFYKQVAAFSAPLHLRETPPGLPVAFFSSEILYTCIASAETFCKQVLQQPKPVLKPCQANTVPKCSSQSLRSLQISCPSPCSSQTGCLKFPHRGWHQRSWPSLSRHCR